MNRGFAVAFGMLICFALGLEAQTNTVNVMALCLMGGLIAYISCHPMQFFAGVYHAGRESVLKSIREEVKRLKVTDRQIILWHIERIIWALVIAGSWGFVTFVLFIFLFSDPAQPSALKLALLYSTLFSWVVGMGSILIIEDEPRKPHLQTREGVERSVLALRRRALRFANPVSFVVLTICLGLYAIGMTIFVVFLPRAFAYTHTAERRVCFLDATICLAASYTFGFSPLLGVGIGFLVGLAHYPLTRKWAEATHKHLWPYRPLPARG